MGAQSRTRRIGAVDVVRWVLSVVVLGAVVVALVANWSAVGPQLRRISPGGFAAAAALSLASPALAMAGWRAVLAGLGSPLSAAHAGGVFFVGQLGKYLPGSVWTVVAQTEIAARLGVPRRRSAVAGVVQLGLSVVSGLLVGLPALPALVRRQDSAGQGPVVVALVVVSLLGAVVVLSPPVLNRLIGAGLRLLRRPPLDRRLTLGTIAAGAGWSVLAWLAMGLAMLVLTQQVAPGRSTGAILVPAVCGFALAGVLGMIAVLLPAGVGVRDGALVLLLGPIVGVAPAAAAVVVSRFLTVAADIVVAALGWVYARTHHLLPGSSAAARSVPERGA